MHLTLMKSAILVGLLAIPGAALAAGCKPVPGEAAISTAVVKQVNEERARRGLGKVRTAAKLQAAADGYACQMARSGRFSHQGARGSTPKTRAERQGYRACLIAENIGFGYPDAAAVVVGWMNSPGHRRNILLRKAADVGVGVSSRSGRLYWVLVLGRPC